MIDLSTVYLGLKLKNPVVAASCGLTGTLDGIKKLENSGVAAVVLKSIFEEEILMETNRQISEADQNPLIYSDLSETLDYIDLHVKEDSLGAYLGLISEAKKSLTIPVIASINCVSNEDWMHFARKIEDAGADALELNLFLHPADFQNKEFEKAYFRIIGNVLEKVSIPLSIKISKYFTRMGLSVKALSESGVKGMVLFNRFFTPDIDIDDIALTGGNKFSTPGEQAETLRWIAIMSNKVSCDLAASTGIHSGKDLIKMLLAGATVTQIASTLYKHGPDQVANMISSLQDWMTDKGFDSISQFRGMVSKAYEANPATFDRMQFMKQFSEIG